MQIACGDGGRAKMPLTMLLAANAILDHSYDRERVMSHSTTSKRQDADKSKKSKRKMAQASRKRNR
jgi:hypothetical protein